MKGKIKHILKAVGSGLIWGLGQVFNKQYFKALFFFVFFVILVAIELGTSNLISGYDPYDAQLSGEDFGPNLAKQTYTSYKADKGRKVAVNLDFEEFYESHKQDEFTNEELIEFLAQDILAGSKTKYFSLTEYLEAGSKDIDRDSDLIPGVNDSIINELIALKSAITTYRNPATQIEYYQRSVGTGSSQVNEYVNVNDETDVLSKEAAKDFEMLTRNNVIFYDNETKSKFYLEVSYKNEKIYYENIQNNLEKIPVSEFDLKAHTKLTNYTGSIRYNNDQVFIYYNPEINGYKETPFTKYFSSTVLEYLYGIGSKNDQQDLARFKLMVYFAMHPDVKNDFETRFDNFFYNRAGFFLEGFWGIITLGQTDSEDYTEITLLNNNIKTSSGMPIATVVVKGHVSSYILIRSLISTLLLMYFVVVFIWNIKDAYKTSIEFEKTHVHVKDSVYFKKMYESTFEYFVLLPAIFTITFISVMPIVFSFLIAFTSYSGQASDVGLFNWVGFKNFANIFVFGGDIPFGQTFWKVFIWTVIWAVFSTITVFFGGFFQAIVINSERVPLKKFWRTILILPWAIPAIITQMTFANIFNESGVVNAFLQNIGLYDVFKEWGILGVRYSEITSGIQKAFYLGEDNIQWFTNAYNPWFVRIVLIIVNIWIGFPYYMALMTGVMTGLDKSLYEAADMDGAGKWQKFKYVTFPLVMYSTAPLLVMSFSGNFNNFGMIYFVTQGGTHAGDIATAYAGDTDILISWMYSLTVDYKNYNMASVFAILIFFIVGSIAAWNYSRTKAFKED